MILWKWKKAPAKKVDDPMEDVPKKKAPAKKVDDPTRCAKEEGQRCAKEEGPG